MFTMCLGWCLPPTKHRMSGSCHHGLLIRAVNTELDGCLCQLRPKVDRNPEGTRTAALLHTKQLRLREVKVPGEKSGVPGGHQAPWLLS